MAVRLPYHFYAHPHYVHLDDASSHEGGVRGADGMQKAIMLMQVIS